MNCTSQGEPEEYVVPLDDECVAAYLNRAVCVANQSAAAIACSVVLLSWRQVSRNQTYVSRVLS